MRIYGAGRYQIVDFNMKLAHALSKSKVLAVIAVHEKFINMLRFLNYGIENYKLAAQ